MQYQIDIIKMILPFTGLLAAVAFFYLLRAMWRYNPTLAVVLGFFLVCGASCGTIQGTPQALSEIIGISR